jgi:hypothetical protein
MEHPDVMEGLKLACRKPSLRGIDPERITFYSRRVMVIPIGKVPGMAVWRECIFAAMHLNGNLPAAYFGVPTAQVVELGLEVEICADVKSSEGKQTVDTIIHKYAAAAVSFNDGSPQLYRHARTQPQGRLLAAARALPRTH